MRLTLSFLVPILLSGLALAQQPNGPAATLRVDGLDGPVFPQEVFLATSAPSGLMTLEIEGAPSQPYSLAYTSDSPLSAGLPTAAGLLDLSPMTGRFLIDGIAMSVGGLDLLGTTGQGASSRWALPISGAGFGSIGTFQALIADPSSAFGFTFSGAAQVTLEPDLSRLYVSHSRGSSTGRGNQQEPLLTITRAYNIARATGNVREIWVEAGTYNEQPDPEIGIDLVGGFNASFTAPAPGARSEVLLTSGPMTIQGTSSVITTWRRMRIDAAPVQFQSRPSAVVLIADRTRADFVIEDCSLIAGGAASGVDGGNGGSGSPGQNGASAGSFLGAFGQSPGGDGGNGAQSTGSPTNGTRGGNGAFGGGAGGAGGTPFQAGSNGGNGAGGADGSVGSAAAAHIIGRNGVVTGDGGSGSNGTGGRPGGGGGGGGAFGISAPAFAGGGGEGGGGGSGGTAGQGGSGGGASIGIIVVDGTLTLRDTLVRAGNAGSGGRGGDGGSGGGGGAGGAGAAPVGSLATAGGRGGRGGRGGCGGPGAGGSAGPSFAIYRAGTPQNIVLQGTTMLNFGLPGNPGQGGVCPSNTTLRAPAGAIALSGAISN